MEISNPEETIKKLQEENKRLQNKIVELSAKEAHLDRITALTYTEDLYAHMVSITEAHLRMCQAWREQSELIKDLLDKIPENKRKAYVIRYKKNVEHYNTRYPGVSKEQVKQVVTDTVNTLDKAQRSLFDYDGDDNADEEVL